MTIFSLDLLFNFIYYESLQVALIISQTKADYNPVNTLNRYQDLEQPMFMAEKQYNLVYSDSSKFEEFLSFYSIFKGYYFNV